MSDESRVPGQTGALTGKAIVITRPEHQARQLAALVRAAGGEAILFPVIEIRDAEDPRPLQSAAERLDQYDIALFISPNAIDRALRVITAQRKLPASLTFAAIGPGGAKELARFGVTRVLTPPQRFDSEGLLELAPLTDVAGKHVVIFRGDGGREVLGDTLKARGASVEYVECYRRARPALDPAPLLDAWERRTLAAVTVTSSEGLRNLAAMVGPAGRSLLARTPVFVPHPRIAQAARALEIATVIVTEAGDEGLLAGLVGYFRA